MTETAQKKMHTIFLTTACVGLVFFGIHIIHAAAYGSSDQGLEEDMQTIAVAKKGEYMKALESISGNTSIDYYNRGVLQTIIAYQDSLKNTLSGYENAKSFISQAKENFDIAQTLGLPESLQNAVKMNKTTITELSSITEIKGCFTIGSSIISEIEDVQSIIQDIANDLSKENAYLDRASGIQSECRQKMKQIIENSVEQVAMLSIDMETKKSTYRTDIGKRIDNPVLCIETPYENIIASLEKGKQGLENYGQLHNETMTALKNNDNETIGKICDGTKNDAQLNQQIQDSVQDMLEKLGSNTAEEQAAKKNVDKKDYKDFLSEDEKKVLKDMEHTNESRIQTILDLKSKGIQKDYLDDLFNQFYGNSGDFINLHK